VKRFAVALLFIPLAAIAGETWFVGTLASYHYTGSGDYEQRNWGFGIEQRLTDSFAVAGGVYRNSHRRDSLYFGAAWAPLKFGLVSLGIAALLVGGYETVEEPELVKAIFPVVSIDYHGLGLNIPIVPPTNSNAGAIGLQVKWRW
jgi:hypothetical protein